MVMCLHNSQCEILLPLPWLLWMGSGGAACQVVILVHNQKCSLIKTDLSAQIFPVCSMNIRAYIDICYILWSLTYNIWKCALHFVTMWVLPSQMFIVEYVVSFWHFNFLISIWSKLLCYTACIEFLEVHRKSLAATTLCLRPNGLY